MDSVVIDVISVIKGQKRDNSILDKQCVNWAPLFADAATTKPQPDFYDGLKMTADNKQLRRYLYKYIVPALDGPFLPNFIFEFKSSDGSPRKVSAQALYHGSLGARGIHYARSFSVDDHYDNKAYTFSCTYMDGILRFYAHYLRRPENPNEALHWYMVPLRSYLLDDSLEQLRDGISAFRNLRDLAYEMRRDIAASANQKLEALARSGRPLPAFQPLYDSLALEEDNIHEDGAASADELA